MLGSTVLDVAIGVVLTFLGISLGASAVTEAISSVLQWREKTLLKGIEALLGSRAITLDLYNSALVNPLSAVIVADVKALKSKPAYIDARDFASALYTVLAARSDKSAANDEAATPATESASGQPAGPPARLQQAAGLQPQHAAGAAAAPPDFIANIADDQLRAAMASLWEAADGDVVRFKAEIGRWFDRSMDRLSGWYKQRTQLASFIVALLIAVSANANILYLGGQIWTRPAVIADIENGALAKIGDALPKTCDFSAPEDPRQKSCFELRDTLSDLKAGNLIGWLPGPAPTTFGTFLLALLSWLIVAASTLFGASFWFDTLQRLTQLRGTGLVAKRTDGRTSKPDIAARG